MNFRQIREANKLIDEIENLDNLVKDVRSPEKNLTVSSDCGGVILKGEYKTKVIQVLLGIRRGLAEELEKLGVTEELEND